MSTRKINGKALAKHMAAEAAFDMEGTLATIHPDALFEDQPIGLVLRGREACARHYRLWWDAFGIHTDQGTLHWVNDDLLIGESHFTGTHEGPFLGIEPTGKTIRFPFTVIVTFRDGMLNGEKFYYDLNEILRQLGQQSFEVAV